MKVYYMPEKGNTVDTVYIPEFNLWAERFRGVVERYKTVDVPDNIASRILRVVMNHPCDGKLPEWVISALKAHEAAKLKKAGWL